MYSILSFSVPEYICRFICLHYGFASAFHKVNHSGKMSEIKDNDIF